MKFYAKTFTKSPVYRVLLLYVVRLCLFGVSVKFFNDIKRERMKNELDIMPPKCRLQPTKHLFSCFCYRSNISTNALQPNSPLYNSDSVKYGKKFGAQKLIQTNANISEIDDTFIHITHVANVSHLFLMIYSTSHKLNILLCQSVLVFYFRSSCIPPFADIHLLIHSFVQQFELFSPIANKNQYHQ